MVRPQKKFLNISSDVLCFYKLAGEASKNGFPWRRYSFASIYKGDKFRGKKYGVSGYILTAQSARVPNDCPAILNLNLKRFEKYP